MKSAVIALDRRNILNTYNRFPVVMKRGRGSWLWDDQGKRYLDFFTGIAVHALGHTPPSVVAAVKKQAATLSHVTNLFYTRPQVELAQWLTRNSFASKVAFANSGAEANELCIKLARMWGARKGRRTIVAMKNSFHGRTYGALSATGQPSMHKAIRPMLSGFRHVALNDFAALKKASRGAAAVMLETVQGEGGVHPADLDYLKAVRRLCDQQGMLLMVDEIQTGLGRTGKMWGYQHAGAAFKPDLAAVGKSLGGGLPLSAVLVSKKVEALMGPGGHGTTLGGNPVACAAGLAMVKELKAKNLAAKAAASGRELVKGLKALQKRFGIIGEIRGRGLMIGAVLDRPAAPVVKDLLKRGLVANATSGNVLRLLPALNLSKVELRRGLSLIGESFASLR